MCRDLCLDHHGIRLCLRAAILALRRTPISPDIAQQLETRQDCRVERILIGDDVSVISGQSILDDLALFLLSTASFSPLVPSHHLFLPSNTPLFLSLRLPLLFLIDSDSLPFHYRQSFIDTPSAFFKLLVLIIILIHNVTACSPDVHVHPTSRFITLIPILSIVLGVVKRPGTITSNANTGTSWSCFSSGRAYSCTSISPAATLQHHSSFMFRLIVIYQSHQQHLLSCSTMIHLVTW